jgi:2-polyprenyl-3-methyl-5-hydroxy-6-metoxy-1,4-benzoquinol methylase
VRRGSDAGSFSGRSAARCFAFVDGWPRREATQRQDRPRAGARTSHRYDQVLRLPTETGRFAFGRNWKRYVRTVAAREVGIAADSLHRSLGEIDPHSCSFLDIGCGSGLMSAAACRLGFRRVVSFDYDSDSVEATHAMRRAQSEPGNWTVLQGSVLDDGFMTRLGRFDVVYSWGVLHHTGDMWAALDRALAAVAPGGRALIALYNDQGWISQYWAVVKQTYIRSPAPLRALIAGIFYVYFGVGLFVADLLRLRNPLRRHSGDRRGMKFRYDVVDWVGGYPFEVARPQEVENYARARGFDCRCVFFAGRRHGCNEYLLRRLV